MACKVRYLSSAGVQYREVKGLEAIASAFPIHWLVYASLNAFPKNSAPIEIDVFVVMDDRVVLLEIKDWNGPLSAKGDMWVHSGKYERSPVVLGNEKAKKIKGIIKNQIPQLKGVYVDSRVVLTATSTRDNLPADQQPFVLTLEEAKRLADRKERIRLLGNVTLGNVRPNMLVKDFEKLFGNGSYFQPRKMNWDGYVVSDEDFYVHRKDVWREHRAQLNKEERVKALLRLWRFDKLPVGLNEPNGRRLIADRELKAIAYLGDQGSWMAERGILKQVGAPPAEVLTEHHQLLSVSTGWTTLRRYIERNKADFPGEHRVDVIHTLALMVAELHTRGVAHRDIGGDSIWLGSPTSVALTGFFSATLPDETSVSNFLEVLGTYSELEPDWDGELPTGKERDVRSLGLLMRELAELDGERDVLPEGWAEVANRAIGAPRERYRDAIAFADAIGELRTPSGPKVDQSRLDDYQTNSIPYVQYPAGGEIVPGANSSRYPSGVEPEKVIVKVWNGLMRGDARRDYALLSMLEAGASLKAVPLPGIAPVIASGLSPVGPFVVTRWIDGATLEAVPSLDQEVSLNVLTSLVSVVDALHFRGLAHGDLHPGNIIVREDDSVVLIDLLDISAIGGGRVRTPAWAPEGYERLSDQQIDRFAVCGLVSALAAKHPQLADLLAVATLEMKRYSIETLDPISEAIELEQRKRREPQPRSFNISAPNLSAGSFVTDDGHLWLKVFKNTDGVRIFWITGLNERILIRIKDGAFEAAELHAARLSDLGHGVRVPLNISLAKGEVSGIAELAAYLQTVAPIEADQQQDLIAERPEWEGEDQDRADDDIEAESVLIPIGPSVEGVDVSRMWLRAAEIEEDTVLQVRLDRRLADEAQAAVYEYQTPQPLEFEDDDTVEVREGGMQGRRIGFLDVPNSGERHLAIRDQRFSIAEGELVALVDRRDRVSKERRRRAVERITRRSGVIPGLIDYFDAAIDAVQVKYNLRASEKDLEEYQLNKGQQTAFQGLLGMGPVGLLQGPPGSGKTKFIASLAHWLLTKGGAKRVLLASQSHEAVNNVLEEVLKTYRSRGGHADLLRVGSRGATERVRPYQARALRDRYRIRFENGLKTRVAHAAGASGISRTFVHDVVNVDQALGSLHRSIQLANVASEANAVRDERRRSESRLRTLLRAFSREASKLLEREIEVQATETASFIDEAYAAILTKHPKASLGDLATVKRLLTLANEWKETLASGHRNFDEFLAKSRRVVAGTCVGLGQSQIRLEEGTFDWVIVDEAARCTSGELAVPLQLGSRVVLVGDQRQLRPMVDLAVQEGLRDEFPMSGKLLAQSDFERAFDAPYGKRNACILHEQYRMAPAISDLVSEIFYAPHGVKLEPSKDRKSDDAFRKLSSDLSQSVIWFDTAKEPNADEHTRNDDRDIWNEAEISTVLSLLHRLSREDALIDELAKRNEPAIGIICMYSEQKRRIEREWSQQPFPEIFRRMVTIDTVDAYQGKENPIVIVTLVRANSRKNPGHVGRENRCNVALSRAKERLYIIGNSAMWSSPRCHSPMRKVLARISKMKEHEGGVKRAVEARR